MAIGYGTIAPEILLILCFVVSFIGAALSGLLVAFAFRPKRRRCTWHHWCDNDKIQSGELVEFILNNYGVPQAVVSDERGYLTVVSTTSVKLK